MEALVASPYGMAGPYRLAHGGAQGDNVGVGYFIQVLKKGTKYLRYVVRHAVRPSGPQPSSYAP